MGAEDGKGQEEVAGQEGGKVEEEEEKEEEEEVDATEDISLVCPVLMVALREKNALYCKTGPAGAAGAASAGAGGAAGGAVDAAVEGRVLAMCAAVRDEELQFNKDLEKSMVGVHPVCLSLCLSLCPHPFSPPALFQSLVWSHACR